MLAVLTSASERTCAVTLAAEARSGRGSPSAVHAASTAMATTAASRPRELVTMPTVDSRNGLTLRDGDVRIVQNIHIALDSADIQPVLATQVVGPELMS